MHVLFNATTFCVELCTFKIRELLMLLTYERRFTRTCFLQDGDFCRGFCPSRLPVFASPCSEVTALGHKLKLVKLFKKLWGSNHRLTLQWSTDWQQLLRSGVLLIHANRSRSCLCKVATSFNQVWQSSASACKRSASQSIIFRKAMNGPKLSHCCCGGTIRLPLFAGACPEVTALGHNLKLVELCKKPLGVESQTHCAMVY